MLMRTIRKRLLLSGLALTLAASLHPQGRRQASALPQISIENYNLQLTLDPDPHELKAVAAVTFKVIETTDVVVLQLSENLSVVKITDLQGTNLDFTQDDPGPGSVAVHFPRQLNAGESVTIKMEYDGGFDLDRFSRNFTRDENSAYIGLEGSYLLYPAKWFPVNKLFVDRPTATVEVTVPLGMTAVGPGVQMPIVTHDITETFGWSVKQPETAISIVAGRYFERKAQFDDLTIDCYAREDHIDAIRKSAEAVVKPLAYYQQLWGDSASGKSYRLVEVADRLALQPGTAGTIFVTHKELTDPTPPVRSLARRAAYQWWMDTVGIKSPDDLWLADGMAYYSAALYLGQSGGPEAMKEEIDNLAVLALKFESKSPIRTAISLGYGNDTYESIVAGKGASVLNMLQGILGPAKFANLLQQYAMQFAGNGGSTSDFQKLAEQLYGKELRWFFAEWIDTTGVPKLQVDYKIYKTRDGFRVSGSVNQDRDLFRMPVEIEAQTAERSERTIVELSGKSTPFDVNTFSEPQTVIVDPDNKLLRDSDELRLKVQLTLGNDLKQKGDYVEAIRAYEEALKVNPRKSIVHFRLAEVLFEQMNLQASANTFRDALNGDRDPKWIEVWCYMYIGKIYDILGQRQRAMAEYNKALNTKDDYNGAQDEAKKWLATPYTRDSTTVGKDNK
jgi:tetratricopeptide (TPR) repeat protein